MISVFETGERKMLVVRRHWFIIASQAFIFFVLIVLPSIIIRITPFNEVFLRLPGDPLFLFGFLNAAWFLILWGLFFVFWTDYYLDLWIVTDKRIIDIEQKGLFARDVASLRLDKIQDIRVEVKGVIPTILGYGDIHVQSASNVPEFVIRDAPRPYQLKETINKLYDQSLQRSVTA